jgi:hypothetical protein
MSRMSQVVSRQSNAIEREQPAIRGKDDGVVLTTYQVPPSARILGAVVAAQLLWAASTQATECQAIAGGTPQLAAIPAERRLTWLDRRLSIDATRARIWTITWNMGFGTVVVVQGALAIPPQDAGTRAERIVAASTAGIGVLATAILPLKVMNDQRWWERHRARSGDDVCALLNTIEGLFIRSAESEAFGVSPLVHSGNFIINMAAGLVLGLGYGRWSAWAYSTMVGIVVGEIQIGTQPTDVIEDLRLYRAGQLADRPSPPRLGVALAPLMVRDGAGAAVTLRW